MTSQEEIETWIEDHTEELIDDFLESRQDEFQDFCIEAAEEVLRHLHE